jgi:hypothetical protein
VFVTPGLIVVLPVGAAGVPPQVQVVAVCAEAPLPPAATSEAAATAAAPIIARSLISHHPCSVPLALKVASYISDS